MLEAPKGSFSLLNYKIKNFSIKEPEDDNVKLSATFGPTGKYYKSSNTFVLQFNFSVSFGENISTEFIKATIESSFKFDTDIKSLTEIPNYFYANAVAIVFPYLRSFITTLTAVSNIKPLVLPLLNLSFLEPELKENTELLD